ncbi:3-dehydroquinate synthase [Candidatus Parcubacteria bacterium]|jgi:3-dehydroquinate synthase|nr:3-dehydroquinate synthase [Candidatus Parcubacteria bacterium]
MTKKQIKLKIKLPDTRGQEYDVLIGKDWLGSLLKLIKKQDISNIVIVTDNNIEKLYANKLLHSLKGKLGAYNVRLIIFPADEKNKNQNTVAKLQEEMFKYKCGRDTFVVSIGGGVVGDVAGYTAATYMRGIPYVQVPTTLLAMVDSSIGGKTGVNTKYGKNLVGSFYQPQAVYVDVEFLKKLSQRHLINGLVEAVKMFVTHDREMFQFVVNNYNKILDLDKKVLEKIIKRAIEINIEIIRQDEKENGERGLLNFGHTIGHAIEKLSGYKILHGEAVALGILVEAKVAELLGKLPHKAFVEIESFFCELVDIKKLKSYSIQSILKETKLDKKVRAGEVKYVLVKNLGRVCRQGGKFVHTVDEKIVKQALTLLR